MVNKEENGIKTGTTCIAFRYKDGILVGTDNRVTSYKIVSEKFTKIFNLTDKIVLTISGSVSDAQRLIRTIKGRLKLIELESERDAYVKEAAMIISDIQYSAIRSSNFLVGSILAGYDSKNGFSLIELSPEGSILEDEDYVTVGSGSIFVEGVLESNYKKDLSEKDAISLMKKCFITAFKKDNASGGGFEIKSVTKDGVKLVEKKSTKMELI